MNITEFAQIAGVSKAAVSRYFNGGYLSAEKRAMIEAALNATDYQPTAQARMLRTRRTGVVGVLLPSLTSERCARMAESIAPVLEQGGYWMVPYVTGGDPRRETELLEQLRRDRLDGIIWAAGSISREQKVLLGTLKKPLVLLGQQHQGLSCVCHDDQGAARAATEWMLAKGRRYPALIGLTLQDRAAGAARRKGFEEAVREAGLTVPQSRMLFAQSSMESGFQQARRLLTQAVRPDCILCATDDLTLGALQYCRSAGLEVPEDVMLCAIGDSRPGRVAAVPLTSVHLDYGAAGKRAAVRMLELLADPELPPRNEQLGFELRPRSSTGDGFPLELQEPWSK